MWNSIAHTSLLLRRTVTSPALRIWKLEAFLMAALATCSSGWGTAGAAVPAAPEFDHVLFNFQKANPDDGWRLNIWGKNAGGEKGRGAIEVVAGRRGGKALRLVTKDAGSHNFVSPTVPDGDWRRRRYRAVDVWYRGNGTETKKSFQLQTLSPDGEDRYSYTAQLYLGSTRWQRVALRSFWRREGTPPLDLSRLERILVGGSGTSEITIGRIALLGAGKNIYLELIRAPVSDASERTSLLSVTVSAPEMIAVRRGLLACRLRLENDEREAVKLEAVVRVFPVCADEPFEFRSPAKIAAGGEVTIFIPLELNIDDEAYHRLSLTVRDMRNRTISQGWYRFFLSPPRQRRYTDVVLWPPPQIWQPANGYWALPGSLKLGLLGKGDAFPIEHLADQLEQRYGVKTQHVSNASAEIQLEYVTTGVKPEGFVLDVNEGGIRLRAANGRGMYYGARALLDVIGQSSLGDVAARCQHVHCEDWPAVPLRVVYHRIDNYYLVNHGVQTYKDFIYDQVAGGRFNLLILNCRGGVAYETHPELALPNAMTRQELRQVLDFARTHYVDVAPGGNSPGHADWLIIPHPELREDGDKFTLCTRHPDTLPLLRDVYGELIDLFRPTSYFHLGGDEVRWKTRSVAPQQRCPRCRGVEKRDLLLEHWTALIEFCRGEGVQPILWEDMLSEKWNGGRPYYTARILPGLPKGTIIASWSTNDQIINAVSRYRQLGLAPWKVNTSFGSSAMENLLSWWYGYDACGIAVFMPWPWCNFIHTSSQSACGYSTPAIHCCAACCWKPETAARSWEELVASDGIHWIKVMQVTPWGTRKLRYQPVAIGEICNSSTRGTRKHGVSGGKDLAPAPQGLRALPKGRLVLGEVPFDRPVQDADCVVLRGRETSLPVPIGKNVRGLVFLHTAAAPAPQTKRLHQRFFRENTSHYGMPVATYRVRYVDGTEVEVPVKLGWNVGLWNGYEPARIVPGARAFWTSQTGGDDAASDGCAWTMEWKNPKPDVAVKDVSLAAEGTEATIVLLGITAVE